MLCLDQTTIASDLACDYEGRRVRDGTFRSGDIRRFLARWDSCFVWLLWQVSLYLEHDYEGERARTGGASEFRNIRCNIGCKAISYDATRVVSGSYDGTLLILNMSRGTIEHLLEGHSEGVWSIAYRLMRHALCLARGRLSPYIAGEVTSTTEYNSCQLSDGSNVSHCIWGQLHLSTLGDQVIHMSRDNKADFYHPRSGVCLIPPKLRNLTAFAFPGFKVYLECDSGHVIISCVISNC